MLNSLSGQKGRNPPCPYSPALPANPRSSPFPAWDQLAVPLLALALALTGTFSKPQTKVSCTPYYCHSLRQGQGVKLSKNLDGTSTRPLIKPICRERGVALSAVDVALVFCLFRFLNQFGWATNQTDATTTVKIKTCCKGY